MKHRKIIKHIKTALLVAAETIISTVSMNFSLLIWVMIVADAGITASRMEGRSISYFLTFLMVTTTLLVINYIVSISKRINDDNKPQIPTLPYRLTRKENGQVLLKDEDSFYKAVRYLADVEDYIERNGLQK